MTVDAISQAAAILELGGLVAFPTETVYGLGADAENPTAIAKIYRAKDRPSNHPIIVHLPPESDLTYWAASIPEEAKQLMSAFWPGPLTLILQRAHHIPDAVSGGQNSIGVRCPSHPVAIALLRAFKQGKGGIAAPSANKFGHVSPTTAQHVRDEFPECGKIDQAFDQPSFIDVILNGGQSEVGIESTILDLSRIHTHGPVLLRPGHISAAQIANVIGINPKSADDCAPRVSGTLDAHYAPRTPLALVDSAQLEITLQKFCLAGHHVALMHYSKQPQHHTVCAQIILPDTASGYAHHLYATLRQMDQIGADVIVVETPSQEFAWQGINDRLRRAAHDSIGILERLLGN